MKRTLIWCASALALGLVNLSALAQAVVQRVLVSQFSVSGNTLLPAATVDAALAPFKGERTMAELKQAALAVQELYRSAGYGAVVAYLPEQSIRGGQVSIAVLEGRIDQVVVVGAERTSVERLRAMLPQLKEGTTPQLRILDNEVQFANENPARQVAVVLEAGRQGGAVDARISVTEKPLSAWTFSADNTGTPQTGEVRVAAAWRYSSLWGLDHQLALQYQTSLEKPSQVSIASASYSVPLYGMGMRIDAYVARSDVDGGSTATAAGALQFVGRGNVLGVRASKLLQRWGEYDQRWSVALDQREYLNDCSIAGLPAGACGAAGESVAVTPVVLEYTLRRGGDNAQGLNVALTRNLDRGGKHASVGNFDAVRAGAKPGYSALRWSMFVQRPLPALGDWRINLQLAGQLTSDALVPGEQFGVAGVAVVRGYREREVVGDNALVANLELLGGERQHFGLAWRPALFVDAGRAWNRLETPCLGTQSSCTLGAVGFGVRSGPGPWQLRADVAVALKDGTRTERNKARVHVSASYTFE